MYVVLERVFGLFLACVSGGHDLDIGRGLYAVAGEARAVRRDQERRRRRVAGYQRPRGHRAWLAGHPGAAAGRVAGAGGRRTAQLGERAAATRRGLQTVTGMLTVFRRRITR